MSLLVASVERFFWGDEMRFLLGVALGVNRAAGRKIL
jgi:hypothetical protein